MASLSSTWDGAHKSRSILMVLLGKRVLFFTLLLVVVATQVHAYEIELECGKDGVVLNQKLTDSKVGPHLAKQLDLGLKNMDVLNKSSSSCPGSKIVVPKKDSDVVILTSDTNSRARIWSSRYQNPATWFDREKLKNIVSLAIKNGVDPYAALALTVVEAPPYKISKDSIHNGRMGSTVNEVSAAEALGCKVATKPSDLGKENLLTDAEVAKFKQAGKLGADCQSGNKEACAKSKSLSDETEVMLANDKKKFSQLSCFATATCKGIVIPTSQIKEIDLSTDSKNFRETNVCMGSTVNSGFAYFTEAKNVSEMGQRCCAKLKVDAATTDINAPLGAHIFLQAIKKMQEAKQKAPANLSPAGKVSWLIQGYNGRGVMPGTSMSNCLSGIHMGQQPIYGATAGDIMMNMLMLSPDLASMIQDASAQCNMKPKSLFCSALGTGTHKINSQDFPDLEKNYISTSTDGSPNPSRLQACSKGKPALTFKPWTPEDQKSFLGN